MKRAVLVTALVAGAVLATVLPSQAQFQRYDTMWARSTNGAPLTLDGYMNEPQWAQAESVLVRYPLDNGIPGSGWKDEGGFPATDRTYAVFRFLTVGDQLWMCATVRDSSIGGSSLFNRFDGLLMSIKNHANGSRPATAGEHLISWWASDTTADVGYTIEMRCDMPLNGYDITRPEGDVVEWNCSVYDVDWFWPLAN